MHAQNAVESHDEGASRLHFPSALSETQGSNQGYVTHQIQVRAKWVDPNSFAVERSTRSRISKAASVQAAWSIVLRGYSLSDHISFDYVFTESSSSPKGYMQGRQISRDFSLTPDSTLKDLSAELERDLKAQEAETNDSSQQPLRSGVELKPATRGRDDNDTLMTFMTDPVDDDSTGSLMDHLRFAKDVSKADHFHSIDNRS